MSMSIDEAIDQLEHLKRGTRYQNHLTKFLFSPDLAALLSAAKHDAEIVARLPRTRDDVPVTPGMKLFAGSSARCWAGSMPEQDEAEIYSRWNRWYSTREAALAALSPSSPAAEAEARDAKGK